MGFVDTNHRLAEDELLERLGQRRQAHAAHPHPLRHRRARDLRARAGVDLLLSVGGYWKRPLGVSHGLLVVNRFYENVNRDGKNVVLGFDPATGEDLLVACVWSRWSAPGEPDLLSFAAITDEPPPEVAAAGHDRCIIPIKAEHVDAWLSQNPKGLKAQYAILDDRERPYDEHRLAA